MALVVEDGTGKTTADAYISVADADTYHTNYGNPANWSSSTTAQKEEAIRLGTQYLDALYGLEFKGQQRFETQALLWPRSYGTYRDGWAIPFDEIPTNLERACALAALKVRDGDTLLPDIALKDRLITKERVKAAVVEKETEYAGTKAQFQRYSLIEQLLSDLLEPAGTTERG